MGQALSVTIQPSPIALARAVGKMDVPSFLRREINRLAFSVERFAKQLTPVDTGGLRSSIHASPVNFMFQSVVSTNTNYALFVHDGTKYMRGRPFLTTGAAFAQVAELNDINIRLDKEMTTQFKAL